VIAGIDAVCSVADPLPGIEGRKQRVGVNYTRARES
jgi:hypothetical protein